MEILQGKNLIQRNDVVVDLGSAPGGWSQIARKFVGSKGRVLALDILDMSDPGVDLFVETLTMKKSAVSLRARWKMKRLML